MNNKVWIVIDRNPDFAGEIYGVYTDETLAKQAEESLSKIKRFSHDICIEEVDIDTNVDSFNEFLEDNFIEE